MKKRIRTLGAGILVFVIFGTACDVSQKDVIKNFSQETGMTQEESQQFIEDISEDGLISYYELSTNHNTVGQEAFKIVLELDCNNYIYEWETETLSCGSGMAQLIIFGGLNLDLAKVYKLMGAGYAFTKDYEEAIELIDKLNESLKTEFIVLLFSENNIEEMIKSNQYNKVIIQTELEKR